jgi:hypothetical protein
VIGGLAGCLATIGNGSHHLIAATMTDSYAAGTVNKGDTIYAVVAGGIAGQIQKSKNAAKNPLIANCLATLSYLNGGLRKTYRIVGQIQGVPPPYARVLGRNYAYIVDGEWVDEPVVQNGFDWEFSMLEPPISTWNFKNKVWLLEPGQTSMPLLNHLPRQTNIPIP